MVIYGQSGAIAQMGERLHGMQEVVGSNPIGSIAWVCLRVPARERIANELVSSDFFCVDFPAILSAPVFNPCRQMHRPGGTLSGLPLVTGNW